MSRLTKKIANGVEYYLYHVKGKKNEIKKMKDYRRKKIRENVILNDKQKKEIDEYYKEMYGKKIPYTWHTHYYAFSGQFDKKYIPELLYIPEYEWISNPKEYTTCIEDKNITPLLTYGIEKLISPKIIISCASGVFRDSKYQIISFDEAKEIIKNCGRVFIKPSIESGSGFGCAIIDIKNGIDSISKISTDEILKKYKSNFIIQECIRTHSVVSKLHPESVNTFRVITYRMPNGKIYHTPTTMRIGQGSSFLDNAHAGGMFVGIDDNGNLLEKAHTEYKDIFIEHPDSHIKFKGYCIPQINIIHKKAIEMHGRIPQIGIINWDFTLDEEENAVLIEANTRGGGIWLPQMAWGKGCFGENTDEILKFLKEKRKKYPFNYK